jgi:methylated-DNA-[protein]-cysteine S-methyltransferase
MAQVTEEQVEAVRALVASIPAGRVSTYGDIADAAGLSSPRIVGWIMRTDSSDLPWHRVIGASGRPAADQATRTAAGRRRARARRPGAVAGGAPPLLTPRSTPWSLRD